jgi:hypothetical protein
MSRGLFTALALIPLLAACGSPKPEEAPTPAPSAAPAAAPTPVQAGSTAPVMIIPNAPAGWKTYSDPKTGIAFDYAPDRHTGDCPEIGEGTVCVALFEPNQSEALIQFQPVDGALEAVAKEQAGFEPNDKGVLMTTYGRFEPVPVERFFTRGGPGLKATVTCGTEDAETGFHAAGGECLWAVASDGTHAVVATTQGVIGLDEETMTSLTSVRFIPKS